jgi:hypothetical protein
MRKWLFISAVLLGILIAWVDSHPTWDDAGITAFAILGVSGLLGFFSPHKPWVWALAVGIWIPLAAIFFTHNYGGLIVLVFAFVGAYGGMLARRLVDSSRFPNPPAK